jgi:hypothetical protein
VSISAADQPLARDVEITGDALIVHLLDGRSISVPIDWFPALRDASLSERSDWRLIGRGVGIHWEKLDEDVSVRGLLMPEAPAASSQA